MLVTLLRLRILKHQPHLQYPVVNVSSVLGLTIEYWAIFEILTVMLMKIQVFWNVYAILIVK
jgi:hypothetical protein